ncbi:alpha/beta hydrolase family protein [Ottowia sp.]|uniref:alpha/beta hydrolase family protein n=1 Tax=Ottowia sp. TaxID=1898956 RepID=UPI003A83FC2A
MHPSWTWATLAALTLGLAACGGDGGDDDDGITAATRGDVLSGPTVTANFASAADVQAALGASASGIQLMALGGAPNCGVRLASIEYSTIDGQGASTNGTTAVMLPQGSDAACTGARPVLLYAHGTSADRNYNLASPQNGEAALVMAMFASQGFIVVAPNYVGYGASTAGVHPYLNAEQQSSDMLDALRAARTSFAGLGITDSGQLLVSGYSQGGHVAMATARAIESGSYGAEFALTASGPMSGPYALSSMLRTVFSGGVNLGATAFTPLLMTSWQQAYGNLYSQPSDAYEAAYASASEGVLPSTTSTAELLQTGQLAPYLFDSDPLVTGTAMDAVFAAGIGTPNLIRTSYRQAALADAAHPLWAAAARNDLLNWTPTRPMALCYGAQDPVVFGSNSTAATTYFEAAAPGVVTRMNVEDASTVGDTLATAFAQTVQATAATGSDSASAAQAVLSAYHGSLVPPFCAVAVRSFFQQVMAAP